MRPYDIAQLRHAYAHLAAGRTEAAKAVMESVIRQAERAANVPLPNPPEAA